MNVVTELNTNWNHNRTHSTYTHNSGKWELAQTADGRGGHLYQRRGKSWQYVATLTYASAINHVNSDGVK